MAILCASAATYPSDYPLKEDVLAIDGVMKAYYGVVSGPAGFEYDAERDRSQIRRWIYGGIVPVSHGEGPSS
jgi:hypothetical protein